MKIIPDNYRDDGRFGDFVGILEHRVGGRRHHHARYLQSRLHRWGAGASGTLKFKGKEYPVSIGGVSLGATIGASKAELVGEVLNLKGRKDIEGTYTALKAVLAVAGGGKVAHMKNSRGRGNESPGAANRSGVCA